MGPWATLNSNVLGKNPNKRRVPLSLVLSERRRVSSLRRIARVSRATPTPTGEVRSRAGHTRETPQPGYADVRCRQPDPAIRRGRVPRAALPEEFTPHSRLDAMGGYKGTNLDPRNSRAAITAISECLCLGANALRPARPSSSASLAANLKGHKNFGIAAVIQGKVR
jgi:hypothetical protein